MTFVRQRGAEGDRPGVEVESNIRELVRRDATALRQAESDSELAAESAEDRSIVQTISLSVWMLDLICPV